MLDLDADESPLTGPLAAGTLSTGIDLKDAI